MHQNRVNPQGQIISTPARGNWMGNRGHLHDEQKKIVRPFKLKAWLICVLEFKDRKRQIMKPGRYTELFFFDEATAFAAGHRPCFECRRKDYEKFKSLWLKGNPGHCFADRTSIQEIDKVLHRERISADGSKVVFKAIIGELHYGTFIEFEGEPYVLANKLIYHWTPFGYDRKIQLRSSTEVQVLTPASTVQAFRAGYIPQIFLSPNLLI
jgi:hypothetical protein